MAQPMKSPGVAAVLSFFWMGLGQIYNGAIGKGIILLISEVILWVVGILTLGIGFIVLFVIWIWNIFDAYKTAEKYNSGLSYGSETIDVNNNMENNNSTIKK